MSAILRELFQLRLYKRTQGLVTRQVTGAVVSLAFLVAAWQLYVWLRITVESPLVAYGIPLLVAVVGVWCSYRLVNVPAFADFLIAVEAEMRSVWWPSREETWRSAGVVIFVMFFLATILFVFDFVWKMLFQFLGLLS